MSSNSLPTILIFTSSEGHYSLARALEEELSSHFRVIKIEIPIVLSHGYLFLYRWLPAFFTFAYALTKTSWVRNLSIKSYRQQKRALFKAKIEEYQPVACISTYFMCSQVLTELEATYHFKLINIVANPRTLHPVEIIENGMNCVFDDFAVKSIRQISGTAPAEATGWFVRSEFVPVVDKKSLRVSLKLEPDLLTFTLVTGSEGNRQAIAVLPDLIKLNLPLQIIVVCGSNAMLYQQITALAEANHSQVKLHVLGFIPHLAPYIQVADLVLGKAGPNSIFEAVATLVPFLAVSHIGGQENGNLDIIRENQLGYVEENPAKLLELLTNIIHNSAQLEKFTPSLEKMAAYNQSAPAKVAHLLTELRVS